MPTIPMRASPGDSRRLAPLAGERRRRIEAVNALLLSLPGYSVIYYGDELAAWATTFIWATAMACAPPSQWSPDRNAGFSRANPQRLYLPIIIDPEYHYEAVNVEPSRKSHFAVCG